VREKYFRAEMNSSRGLRRVSSGQYVGNEMFAGVAYGLRGPSLKRIHPFGLDAAIDD